MPHTVRKLEVKISIVMPFNRAALIIQGPSLLRAGQRFDEEWGRYRLPSAAYRLATRSEPAQGPALAVIG